MKLSKPEFPACTKAASSTADEESSNSSLKLQTANNVKSYSYVPATYFKAERAYAAWSSGSTD